MYKLISDELRKFAKKEKVPIFLRFFKTGKGEYGEGDKFLGISVADTRKVIKKYIDINFIDLQILLNSKYHEERLAGLVILVIKFKKADEITKKKIFNFYLKNIKAVNNWDLVDISCKDIIGAYLYSIRNYDLLYKLAKSKNMWERRISIISTMFFIYKKEYIQTFKIAELLLGDKEDLIHKAVGWMLREVGNKCGAEIEERFLKNHLNRIPRTTLRYAIEKFPQKKRKKYLYGII